MRTLTQIIVTLLCFSAVFLPQNHPAPDVKRLLSQLRSDERSVRVSAVEKLSSEPAPLNEPTVQRALIDLVDRENKELEAAPEDAGGDPSDPKWGEAYGDYLSDLYELANRFIDWDSSADVCTVVHEVYNPDSRFAGEIAAHARIAMPCVLEMANSNDGMRRYRVTEIIVEALARNQMDSGEEQNAREALHKALHDKSAAVRRSTLRGIKKFGDASMLPDLADLAQTDPDPGPRGARALAAEAITAIKSRQNSTK